MAADTAPTKPPARPAFQPLEIYAIGFAWQTYAILVPGTVPLADMLKTETWAHVARLLKVNDTIEVKSQAGLYVATLNVTKVFVGGAQVEVVNKWEAAATPKIATPGFKVEFAGARQKWRVVEEASGEVVGSGYDTEAEAKGKLPAIIAERTRAAA